MTTNEATEKLAENAVLTVAARFSMLLLLPLFGVVTTLAWQYVDGRFEAQAAVTQQLRGDVDKLNDELPIVKERTKVLENNQDRGRAERLAFQAETTKKLDGIMATQTAILQELAALRATTEERRRQNR